MTDEWSCTVPKCGFYLVWMLDRITATTVRPHVKVYCHQMAFIHWVSPQELLASTSPIAILWVSNPMSYSPFNSIQLLKIWSSSSRVALLSNLLWSKVIFQSLHIAEPPYLFLFSALPVPAFFHSLTSSHLLILFKSHHLNPPLVLGTLSEILPTYAFQLTSIPTFLLYT